MVGKPSFEYASEVIIELLQFKVQELIVRDTRPRSHIIFSIMFFDKNAETNCIANGERTLASKDFILKTYTHHKIGP